MRVLTFVAPAVLLLAAVGCAPTTTGDHYASELERLTEQCSARGGFLAPTGTQSGRPQTDNVCKINAEPSRLTRN